MNNSPLNNHLVREEIKKEIKDFLESIKNGGTTKQNLGHNESSAKKIDSTKCLHKEIGEVSF
jgi:ribosomal protein S20